NNQNQNYQNQDRNQGNNHGITQGNNQGRNQFLQGASHGQNPPPAYQALAYQASGYQASVHQAPIPQPQFVTTTEFANYMKANDVILKIMQTNMTSLTNSNLELKNMFGQFMKMNTASSSGSGTPLSNTVTNLKEDLKGITTRSGNAYQGPTIPTTSSPPKVVERKTKVTKDTVPPTNNGSTKDVQPLVVQVKIQVPNSELAVSPIVKPVEARVSAPKLNPKPSIPYPSRLHDQKLRNKANDQKEKIFQIFQDLNFNISFVNALILMPNYQKKLGDPDKFLIPCDFLGMDECLALSDLGASINLMPLSVWKGLSRPELTPTSMTLELADRSVSKPIGITKDVSVKVGVFHFPADFVVVDFEPDPRVPLILGRCFLKTGQALIDVHKGELTLRIKNEAITYNLDQTSRYSANYNQMTANKIDVIDLAYEEYSQEVLGFSNVITSGNPTPHDDPIVSTTSSTLTPFGDSDFLLFEEADAFLGLEDDLNSSEFNPFYYDPEGTFLLETILNSLPPLPNHEKYLPSFKKELKVCEAKIVKSSVDEPPEVELKDLPHHLEYAFLKGDNKLPVSIAKELGDEEKSAQIKVLKSHKRAIAWKLSDIQGINPEFCTHKILIEEDYKAAVQHQRRVNPKIHDVIKKEVEKLLDDGLIYPISDSPWVSPIHCVPKKGGFTIVENEENELIPTHLVTGWRIVRSLNRSVLSKMSQSKLTGRTLIDVHKGELTLRIRNEAITYNLDQTLRYSANYDQMTANKIDVTDEGCEEYFQKVLGFSDVTASGSPTPSDDPIVSTTSPMLTPFEDSDFLLFEEANAFLGLEDDPDSSKFDPSYYDPKGDIQMLEAILNSDPAPSLPDHEQSVPSFTNELKAYEAKTIKSSVDEPPEVELKDLPPHLEYVFLEGDNKFPVIITKELGDKEKAALIKVLKSHK
nr:reverse transcriptase domain-containing protein [Tanacetum cinerariifolium]